MITKTILKLGPSLIKKFTITSLPKLQCSVIINLSVLVFGLYDYFSGAWRPIHHYFIEV